MHTSGNSIGELAYGGNSGLAAWSNTQSLTADGALLWHRLYREWYELIKGIMKGVTTSDGRRLPPAKKKTGNPTTTSSITEIMKELLKKRVSKDFPT